MLRRIARIRANGRVRICCYPISDPTICGRLDTGLRSGADGVEYGNTWTPGLPEEHRQHTHVLFFASVRDRLDRIVHRRADLSTQIVLSVSAVTVRYFQRLFPLVA